MVQEEMNIFANYGSEKLRKKTFSKLIEAVYGLDVYVYIFCTS
jgi:hypothetical protein